MALQFAAMGLGFVVLGLAMAFAGRQTARSSRGGLPPDGDLLVAWSRHGVTPLPDASPALRRAAARLKPTGTAEGARLLALPAASGVRLAGRLEVDAHEVFVGDVWDVTSVLRVNGRPTQATVKVRATAAIPLDLAGPPVVVAAEDHLSLLLDAVGLDDVQVESETFNREWRVRSRDRAAAVAVLTPEVQVALQGRADDWALEVRDGLVSIHQLGVRAEGSGLAACFEELVVLTSQVLAGLRPHTWPDARPADWTDATIDVDHRPPGMAHPNTGSPGCSGAFFIGIGVVFAAIGSLFVALSFVIPDL